MALIRRFFEFLKRRRGLTHEQRIAIFEYFRRLQPTIARVVITRKAWLGEMGRIVTAVGEDKSSLAMRLAAETSRVNERVYAEYHETLKRVEPPPEAALCHLHLMAWVDGMTRANALLGEMARASDVHKLREARLAMRDARDAVEAYNAARLALREKYGRGAAGRARAGAPAGRPAPTSRDSRPAA